LSLLTSTTTEHVPTVTVLPLLDEQMQVEQMHGFIPSLGGYRANVHTASAEAHLKADPLHNPTPY